MSQDDFSRLKSEVEAVLFSYGDWISKKDIQDTLVVDSELLVTNALKEIQDKFKDGYSFHVENHEDGIRWRMALKEEFSELVSDVVTGTEIPKNVLKVLGVIAYEQPITKTRLSEILGKSVKQEVGYLYRNKFLSYEKHGIGKYYKVTKKFYDYFKLEETEDFRAQANKSISTYLEEPITKNEESNDEKEVSSSDDEENISK